MSTNRAVFRSGQPVMPVCCVCGKPKLNAEQFGKNLQTAIVDLVPCPECIRKHVVEEKGVILIEVVSPERKTPTGHTMILREEAYHKIFKIPLFPSKVMIVGIGVIQHISRKVEEAKLLNSLDKAIEAQDKEQSSSTHPTLEPHDEAMDAKLEQEEN